MQTKKGFTIIEVLIAGSLMLTLALAVFGLQDLFRENQSTAFNSFSNVTQANRILKQFNKEIRRARVSENGSYSLDTLEENEIIFFSDTNLDGTVERVRYTLVNNTLTKGIVQATGIPATYPIESETIKILSEDVQNKTLPLFEYYNSSWPTDVTNNPLIAASRLSDTRQVRFFLIINNNLNEETGEYVLDSFTNIRNL